MHKRKVLTGINFGKRVAEEEEGTLAEYFVETEHWRKLFAGEVDIVYGPKGSGKSALYSLLVKRSDELLRKQVIVTVAENPRGAPAFRDLAVDAPSSESEFGALWKLYFASLLHAVFEEHQMSGAHVEELRKALEQEGLVKGERTLQTLVKAVWRYARRLFRPKSVEAGVELDPVTQMPKGVTGKISFLEPTEEATKAGFASIHHLLKLANDALAGAGFSAWVVLDRLDVAFTDNDVLEQNALRGLFRVYLDLLGFSHIRLKIFLRTDIWRHLTEATFREASHITSHMTIDWSRNSLLNLIVRRAICNRALMKYYGVYRKQVLASTNAVTQTVGWRIWGMAADGG